MVRQLNGSGSGGGVSVNLPTREFSQVKSQNAIRIQPGESKDLIHKELDRSALWWEVGSTDSTYTSYTYLKDGEDLFDEEQREPLGLYNSTFRFPQPIIVNDSITVRAQRDADADGFEDYYSKIKYVPIDARAANRLKDIIDTVI